MACNTKLNVVALLVDLCITKGKHSKLDCNNEGPLYMHIGYAFDNVVKDYKLTAITAAAVKLKIELEGYSW